MRRGCLAVGVEAVDTELDLCEDATGGVQLMDARSRLYHLRIVWEDPGGGACMEEYRRLRVSSGLLAGHLWEGV